MVEKAPAQCRLQILLAPEARSAEARKQVCRELERLGLEVSGEGAASLSARVSPARFEQVFGCEASAAGDGGAGVALPEKLRETVISITVAPDHLHLD